LSGAGGGRYRTRFAQGAEDLRRAQALRFRCFRGGEGLDADAFDARAAHVLVEEAAGGRLACCFRLLRVKDGSRVGASYSAQFYGLDGLARHAGPMLELGRFCVAPEARDPAVLRLAWRALAAEVAAEGVALLFGCSSFPGLEPERHAEAFALLRERHLGPRRWRPEVKAPVVHRFARRLRPRTPDPKAATRAMPPLLRSYLAMGGWVSDHAVVDRDLGRLHVFTALETRAVPPARVRALRAAPAA
jgi:putative hemolysin